MELIFPLLNASDVEIKKGRATSEGISLMIYKNARVDQTILDASVTRMGWQNSYSVIDGKLFCTISIWDEIKEQWVSKSNVGAEPLYYKEKGEASDAFKRAAFNWGIGRELYSAPRIWVPAEKTRISQKKDDEGSYVCDDQFEVKEIEYDGNRKISRLVITGAQGTVFVYGNTAPPVQKETQADNLGIPMSLDEAFAQIVSIGPNKGKTMRQVWDMNSATSIIWIAEHDAHAQIAASVIIASNTILTKRYDEAKAKKKEEKANGI